MTYALQDHKPGDTVDVVVVRGGERLTLRATLGTRGETRQAPQPAASPAPMPAASTAPAASPQAGAGSGEPDPAAAFYADRPGNDFVIGAGRPFATATAVDAEKHLADLRQLTFGGENAEAYFSPDGTRLI
jgi:hypothetical protein